MVITCSMILMVLHGNASVAASDDILFHVV